MFSQDLVVVRVFRLPFSHMLIKGFDLIVPLFFSQFSLRLPEAIPFWAPFQEYFFGDSLDMVHPPRRAV